MLNLTSGHEQECSHGLLSIFRSQETDSSTTSVAKNLQAFTIDHTSIII